MKLQILKGTEELDLGTVLPLTKKEEDVEEQEVDVDTNIPIL